MVNQAEHRIKQIQHQISLKESELTWNKDCEKEIQDEIDNLNLELTQLLARINSY